MLETYEKNSNKKLIATVLAIIVIAGVVILSDQLKSKSSTVAATSSSLDTSTSTDAVTTPPPTAPLPSKTTTPSKTTPPVSTTPPPTTSTSGYKNGAYTASIDYYVPHGSESIDVNLTLNNGTITDVSIVNSESNHDSQRFQENFAAIYKNYVVGKKISGLKLGVIAGASDTAESFNEALTQIATKAQA